MAENNIPQVIMRKQARELGLKRYFTGKICKYGHNCEKFTSNKKCVECSRIKVKKWREANQNHVKSEKRKWYDNNKERHDGSSRKSREKNKEKRNTRARDHYKKNKEKLSARKKELRQQNLEYIRARTKLWAKQWRDKNKESYSKKRKEWWSKSGRAYVNKKLAENPRYFSDKLIKWNRLNPEKVRMTAANTRARRRLAEGRFRSSDIIKLMDEQKGVCIYCPKNIKLKYEIDHIMPLALGGSNWPINLQLLCPTCNRRKGAKDPVQFAEINAIIQECQSPKAPKND